MGGTPSGLLNGQNIEIGIAIGIGIAIEIGIRFFDFQPPIAMGNTDSDSDLLQLLLV